MLAGLDVKVISPDADACILGHARVGLDTDVHLVWRQFSVIAAKRRLVVETLAVGAVKTILQLILA